MKLGLIGLGRMGAGLMERWRRDGHEVAAYDANPSVSPTASIAEMIAQLDTSPRIVWVMVPAGDVTQKVIDEVASNLREGDIIIDGGNSYYRDGVRRAAELAQRGIRFLDAGTSGGIWGLEVGFCLMVGGPKDAFDQVEPLFRTLAPKDGYAYLGPAGAGHFAKMVHNGIEYAMLEAYAEGFDLLQAAEFDYDLGKIASLWNQGSVVRSWLLELGADALKKDPRLEQLKAYVDDSGEGRWTVNEAIERAVPVPVIAQSLFARFDSRDDNSFAMRYIAALRNEFGGHAVKEAK
ncbi:MAG TPA: decarboxylating 6-phosphogluconate dehydrogenase [Dehalococcoidia bacterium]